MAWSWCPTSAGTARRSCSRVAGHPATPARQPRQHRVPAAPLDLQRGGQHGTPAGTLLGAPHFAQDPCLNLRNYPLRQWNGLLFEDNGRDIAADLAGMGPRADLDFTGMVLDRVEMHECNYNWKTFIEVYLEDYHVGPFHPAWAVSSPATTCAGSSRTLFRADRGCGQSPGQGRCRAVTGLPTLAEGPAEIPRWRAAKVRRDLADLLPPHHGGVVPACAHRVHPAPDRAAENA
jgi:hypothetical protein